jgi:uncharacterized protein YutE (UPF0331/DUF86 family)
MDQVRKDRYLDKLNWIYDRSRLIGIWQEDLSDFQTLHDIKTVLAIFKAFQEITEAFMDCIAMYLRDNNIPPRDDYTNIDRVDLFSNEQKQLLREMNGLRNRIIHRYNGTDDTLALTGICQSLSDMISLAKTFQVWIDNS